MEQKNVLALPIVIGSHENVYAKLLTITKNKNKVRFFVT